MRQNENFKFLNVIKNCYLFLIVSIMIQNNNNNNNIHKRIL